MKTTVRVALALLVSLLAVMAFGSFAQAAKSDLRAALVITQQEGDKGPIDLIVTGFKRGAQKYGYKDSKVVYVGDSAQYTSTLRRLAEDGYNIIECTWPPMSDAIAEVAPAFPNTYFMLFDGDLEKALPNVKTSFYKEDEAGFLAGVLAAKLTKTNRLGFVGNVDIDVIHRFLTGYSQGARYVNPKITMRWSYVGVEDPAKGKETANLYFGQGIDIIHTAASRSSLGVFEAAVKANKLVIGSDSDVIALGPKNILTSVGVFFDNTAEQVLKEVADGTFKPGLRRFGLAEQGVGLTPLNKSMVPANLLPLLQDLEKKILSGQIKLENSETYYVRMKQGQVLPEPKV